MAALEISRREARRFVVLAFIVIAVFVTTAAAIVISAAYQPVLLP